MNFDERCFWMENRNFPGYFLEQPAAIICKARSWIFLQGGNNIFSSPKVLDCILRFRVLQMWSFIRTPLIILEQISIMFLLSISKQFFGYTKKRDFFSSIILHQWFSIGLPWRTSEPRKDLKCSGNFQLWSMKFCE